MVEKQLNKEKNKVNWNIKPYLAVGLTAFIVIFLSILAFFVIFRYDELSKTWDKVMGILQPIIFGLVLAYLVNPIVKFQERHLRPWLKKHLKKEDKAYRLARCISVAGALLFVFIIVGVLLKMVLPELYTSIERVVTQLPKQIESFMDWLKIYISSDNQIAGYVEQGLNKGLDIFENWARTDFLPQTKNMISSLTSGVISIVRVLFNIVIGIIVSIYVLIGKETFVGQAKKLVYAILPARKGNVVIKTVRKSNDILGGFISGKILDSAIIGILCFLCLSLLRMPYTVLVSVIVGVTNVIPFFGPYIGAIPSAILITLASPLQGLYFIIFILILQQVDGNIIGPKILGDSTGLSSFWVVFAILLGGGLFGVVGMIMGVPVFGVIYYISSELVEYVLAKRKLPVDTAAYTKATRVDTPNNKLIYEESENK